MITTLLLSQCDSIVTKACRAFIPVVQETYEAGTNCSDVCIADSITNAVVKVVFICVAGFLAWKLIDHHAKKKVDKRKREWDVEDKTLKLKSDLLDKYLDFLKDQTKGKEFVTMEEFEKQRKFFADGLTEYLKNDLSLYLCTNGKNTKDTEGKTDASKTGPQPQKVDMQEEANNEAQEKTKDTSPKETNEDKPKETTQPKAKDGDNDNNEKKKQSLYNLIEELKKYIHPEKLKPAEIDQAKIERYRKTLEYLIQLSQQGKLNDFSIEELDKLFK